MFVEETVQRNRFDLSYKDRPGSSVIRFLNCFFYGIDQLLHDNRLLKIRHVWV